MKILGIDTSGLTASVAVVGDDVPDGHLIAEYTVNYKKTHSQTLLPMLDEICRMIEMEPEDIDVIAVSAGPGSFTGLRIGSATAKGLGLALDKPIVAVPTVDALAYNLCGTDALVCPIMDARRGQVYTGIYGFSGNEMAVISPQEVCLIEDTAARLKSFGQRVIFLGDGVPVFRERLLGDLMAGMEITFAPAHLNRQRASAVAALAFKYAGEGRTQSADEHAPIYLRLPQAERDRLERERRKGTNSGGDGG